MGARGILCPKVALALEPRMLSLLRAALAAAAACCPVVHALPQMNVDDDRTGLEKKLAADAETRTSGAIAAEVSRF